MMHLLLLFVSHIVDLIVMNLIHFDDPNSNKVNNNNDIKMINIIIIYIPHYEY